MNSLGKKKCFPDTKKKEKKKVKQTKRIYSETDEQSCCQQIKLKEDLVKREQTQNQRILGNRETVRETRVVSLDILPYTWLRPDFLTLNSNALLHF